MTPEEEKIYLTNLLIDSTAWYVSEGETRSAIELEVIDRIRKLQGQESINVVGKPSDEVLNEYDNNAPEAAKLESAKLNEHLASPGKVDEARKKWEKDKIRVYIDGKHVWKKRSECVKQPRDNSKGGPAWKWIWIGPQDKKAQVDAMWAEHEKGK